ncbi:phage protease [Helicobacter trogontum]|uniref:Uncharacterized protein n=1 Tax=Helicobacter trogontum TaxID=50960 RepID=A0A4U8S693_9HELI|nr:phage protease [Helicobacter trogontum]TLD81306.1 hypothetical protein LS81_008690 [Helicobacter trogontum]
MTTNAVFLECNAENNNTKIKISPIGEFSGVDGRKYYLNAESVLTNTKKIGTDLMLDKNHEDNEAMGWFSLNSLEIREDGLYATLNLNSIGEGLIKDRVFRYLSPAYSCKGMKNNAYVVERIASIGLVNRPNVLFSALNKERANMQGNNTEGSKNMADLEKLKEELSAALSENEALKKKLETLQKEKDEILSNSLKEKIENAISCGEMLPARRESALALNGSALDSYLEVCREEAKHVLKNKSVDFKPQGDGDGIDSHVKAQLGL